MSAPGLLEWVIILGVIVLLFGANKLPQLGGAIGETIKNFKRGLKDTENDRIATQNSTDDKKPEQGPPSPL